MKCSLCGHRFEERASTIACKGCLFLKGCNMIRCPNCGFEMPVEPKIVKAVKKWRRNRFGFE